MAASLNKVFLMGNLTKDPEVRYTPQGTAVATLRIAVSRRYKAGNGEMKEETSFFNIVVWGKSGENCGKYLTKGRPVLVEGRLVSRTYETQDKQKRTVTEVVADGVQFLGGGGGGGGARPPSEDAGGELPPDPGDAIPEPPPGGEGGDVPF